MPELDSLKDKFVAGPIERAHPAIALDPNAEVQEFAARRAAGSERFRHMPPVHAGVDQGARHGVLADGQLIKKTQRRSLASTNHQKVAGARKKSPLC